MRAQWPIDGRQFSAALRTNRIRQIDKVGNATDRCRSENRNKGAAYFQFQVHDYEVLTAHSPDLTLIDGSVTMHQDPLRVLVQR